MQLLKFASICIVVLVLCLTTFMVYISYFPSEGNLQKNIDIREKNYRTLEEVVRGNSDLINPVISHITKLSSFAFPVLCKTPGKREKYLAKFSGAGVEIRPMIAGNIQRQPFFKKYVERFFDLPDADFMHENAFYCGNYPDLTEMDIQVLQNCLSDY